MPSLNHLWQAAGVVRRRGQKVVQRWTSRLRPHPPFTRTLLFEALEQRILMSADIAPLSLLDSAPVSAGHVEGAIDVPGETDSYVFDLAKRTLVQFDGLRADTSALSWSLTGPDASKSVSSRAILTDYQFSPLDLPAGSYMLAVDASGSSSPPCWRRPPRSSSAFTMRWNP